MPSRTINREEILGLDPEFSMERRASGYINGSTPTPLDLVDKNASFENTRLLYCETDERMCFADGKPAYVGYRMVLNMDNGACSSIIEDNIYPEFLRWLPSEVETVDCYGQHCRKIGRVDEDYEWCTGCCGDPRENIMSNIDCAMYDSLFLSDIPLESIIYIEITERGVPVEDSNDIVEVVEILQKEKRCITDMLEYINSIDDQINLFTEHKELEKMDKMTAVQLELARFGGSIHTIDAVIDDLNCSKIVYDEKVELQILETKKDIIKRRTENLRRELELEQAKLDELEVHNPSLSKNQKKKLKRKKLENSRKN
jgi:hypothetical protein